MGRLGTLAILGVVAALSLVGCGGGDGDTNAMGQGNAPATINCQDHCARTSSCLASLCKEDNGTDLPQGTTELVTQLCLAGCTDSALEMAVGSKWDCLFDNSCRAVFADDVCQAEASYSC